jgi:hypothetical protein
VRYTLRYTQAMARNTKLIGAHVNSGNQELWDKFLELARIRGLSNSQALAQAVTGWLYRVGLVPDDCPDPWPFVDPLPLPVRAAWIDGDWQWVTIDTPEQDDE